MKKYINILIACVLLLISSCSDFFNNDPNNKLTQDQVFEDLESIELTVDALFLKWRDLKKDRAGLIFLLGLDESQQGAYQVNTQADQAGLDKYNTALSPDNLALTEQWDNRWLIIAQANIDADIIEHFNKPTDSEALKLYNSLLGQCYFIRAALHFEVSQYWGEIPIIEFATIAEYGMGRQPLNMVYEQIINDLTNAESLLPETQSDPRRVTKVAAQTLLGKVYMSAPEASGYRDFSKAAEWFKRVIDNPSYGLVDNYADLWKADQKNTKESIYEFQFNNARPDQNQIQWQTGSRPLANYNANCYFGGYDLILPTKYAHSTISEGGVWEDGDLRRNESIRYDFTYKGYTPTVDGWMGGDELDPHIKKYEDSRTDGTMSFWLSGKNVFYLRYADVVLSYAECLNEKGQTSDAVNIVNNEIRKRAWGGTLPTDKKWDTGMSQEQFRTNILDERIRELAFEGWRRVDLLRTGKYVEYVKSRNKWAKESGLIKDFHTRYPIPRTAMLDDSEITEEDQNPGYN